MPIKKRKEYKGRNEPMEERRAQAARLRRRFLMACDRAGVSLPFDPVSWTNFAPLMKKEIKNRKKKEEPGLLKENEVRSSWCEKCAYFDPDRLTSGESDTPCTKNYMPKYFHPRTEEEREKNLYGYKRRCLEFYPLDVVLTDQLQIELIEELIAKRDGKKETVQDS